MDYNKLLVKLNSFKVSKKHTYQDIANAIGVSRATVCKYYNNQMTIPVDKLISLSKYVKCDIDELLGKI